MVLVYLPTKLDHLWGFYVAIPAPWIIYGRPKICAPGRPSRDQMSTNDAGNWGQFQGTGIILRYLSISSFIDVEIVKPEIAATIYPLVI